MERLSKIKSGSAFLFTLIIIFASCPEILTKILEEIDILLIFLNEQEAPVLLSLNFAFLILIISLIAALSFFIEKLWDFIFYFAFKGYNQKEYELIKEYLVEILEDDSKFLDEIKKMKVQPIYGQFLHSYARQTFVNWLARRWDTFHDSVTNSIGIIFAIIFGFGFISIEKYTFTYTTWATLLFSIIFIILLVYVGLQRKKELLMSEKLFCISIVDPDVRDAFYHISEIITRGQENKDIEPFLNERL